MDWGDSFGLFYDKVDNVFIDEDGYIVWDIFELITPNDLYLFKHNKEYMIVNHCRFREVLIELYYPEDDEEFEWLSMLKGLVKIPTNY